ncbi:MAG: TonB-dependent receptor [Amphiplicatus sp.]
MRLFRILARLTWRGHSGRFLRVNPFRVLNAKLRIGETLRFGRTVVALVATTLFFVGGAYARDVATRYDFHIEEDGLAAALHSIVRLTGASLIYPEELADQGKVNHVVGRYTLDEALAALLKGTKFSGGLTKGGVIVIALDQGPQDRASDIPGGKAQKGLLANISALLLPAAANGRGADGEVGSSGQAQFDVITVTARRQAENIQTVPLTVTALSNEQLRRQNILRPTDLQFAAPSVTVQSVLGRLGGTYSVRGLAAGVVTYFSEAPGGPTQVGMPFFDEGSVEMLNGPQGTLFGRTGAAGAVLIAPQHPDLNEFGGYVDYSAGNYGRQQATVAVNAPLVKNELALRVVYHHDHIDGYVRQIYPSQIVRELPSSIDLDQKLDEINSDSVRVGLEWKRGGFDNYLVYSRLLADQAPPGEILTYGNPNLAALNLSPTAQSATFGPICVAAVANGLAGDVGSCIAQHYNVSQQIKAAIIDEMSRIQTGGEDAVRSTPALQGALGFENARNDSFVDVARYDFGDLGPTSLQVKNIFSFQSESSAAGYQLDGLGGLALQVNGTTTALPGFATPTLTRANQSGNRATVERGPGARTITEEFQLHGVALDMIDWTAGFYYQRIKELAFDDGVSTMFRTFSGAYTQNFGFGASFNYQAGSETVEKAGYGQVTIDLDKIGVHGLSVTGGYRHTSDVTVTRSIPVVANPAGTGPISPSMTAGVSVAEVRSSGSNYTAAVNEQITPEILIYGLTSKSYVPGGVNITLGCNIAPNCTDAFEPSTVVDYEIGAKTEFNLGGARVRLNADIFRMNFSNIQQNFRFTSGTVAILYTENVAEARLQGIEAHMDVLWSPIWDMSRNYSYLDAQFLNWVATDPNNQSLPTDVCLPGSATGLCLIDLQDNPFLNAPDHQFNATIRYHLPIDRTLGDAWLSLTGYYQGRQWLVTAAYRELAAASAKIGVNAYDAVSQAPYGHMNFRVQWDNIKGSGFSAAVFVNNITDAIYAQAGSSRIFTSGTAVKLYGPPRMWGVNLIYSF